MKEGLFERTDLPIGEPTHFLHTHWADYKVIGLHNMFTYGRREGFETIIYYDPVTKRYFEHMIVNFSTDDPNHEEDNVVTGSTDYQVYESTQEEVKELLQNYHSDEKVRDLAWKLLHGEISQYSYYNSIEDLQREAQGLPPYIRTY